MLDKWTNLTSSDLWRYWGNGMIDSIMHQTGLLDSSPLDNFVKKVIGNSTLKRKLITGAVDAGSGQFI